jgi:hypothetical protein
MFSNIWGLFKADHSGLLDINSSALKFGTVNVVAPTLRVIPASFIVGAICGVMGGIFVIVNNWMGFFRKFYIKKNWMKPLEAVLFSFISTTIFFWAPYIFPQCIDQNNVEPDSEAKDLLVVYNCPSDKYSTLATMLFNTEGSAIRTIISG